MAAPDTTKFQINYKLSDGTLINLYATDVKDLETGLADLGMVASLIKSTGADLGGGSATVAQATAVIEQAFPGATPVSNAAVAAPVQQAQPEGRSCKHGPMTYKTGTSSRGAWQGYMCPTPKGAPDKCDTIFVK